MKKITTLLITSLCLFTLPVMADITPSYVQVSVGKGRPNNLKGARLAAGWDWPAQWLKTGRWAVTGSWDASAAYWHTNGEQGKHKSVWILAAAPLLRWGAVTGEFRPFVDGSVGLALLSKSHLASRNLGARWSFQDLLGAGVRFGSTGAHEISLHYLHYSNANLAKPNEGIDVKALLSYRYYW